MDESGSTMIEYTRFVYCPRCGKTDIEIFMKNGIRCIECGYIYFHNMCAAVAAIVEIEDKIVLIRRAKEPRAGFFDLPGGFVDYRESLEQALTREVKEETNLDIVDLRYFGSLPNTYVYKKVTYFTADAFFLVRPLDPSTLKLSDENSGYSIIHPGQIDESTMAFPSMTEMIGRYKKNRV